jgi:hypothetical protein
MRVERAIWKLIILQSLFRGDITPSLAWNAKKNVTIPINIFIIINKLASKIKYWRMVVRGLCSQVTWHPVKTEPRCRSWRTMVVSLDAVTFVKASSMVLSSVYSDCSGGNPRSGAPGSDDGGARRRYPCGHHFWSRCRLDMVLLWGNPQIWVSRVGRWRRVTPLSLVGHHFWSRPWLEVALRWSGVSLSVSTTVRLGGLVPRSLGGGHGLRSVRREEAPSRVIGRIDKVYADLNLEDCLEVRWR